VNPYIYLRIVSNPTSNNYRYSLAITNSTEDINPAYDDNENFANAHEFNITAGKIFNNRYLDITHDYADFYKFYALKDQKVEIECQIFTNSKDDFDIYSFDATTASAWVRSSINTGQNEKITYFTPNEQYYYLRVVVKNVGDLVKENRGNYKLTCTGNLPPQWNTSFPTTFGILEDGPNFYIELSQAFHDLNVADTVAIEVWDVEDEVWISSTKAISLNNVVINLLDNQSVKIKTRANKFGIDIVKVRSTDGLEDNYTEKELTINVIPTNDAPILNGTNKWILDPSLTPNNPGTKLTGTEGNQFKCTVTAYEPYDPFDVITFSDDTDMFDINPSSGEISFLAVYNYTGTHMVDITATDNGTPMGQTTKEIEFVIQRGIDGYPEVELVEPRPNSIVFTLTPKFTWKQVNEYFEEKNVTYEFLLSPDEALVTNRDLRTLNKTIYDQTVFELPEETKLLDNTTYYWSVIPNDGLHLGECLSGVYSFKTDIGIERPKVKYLSPTNNQTISVERVTLKWEKDYSGTDKIYYDVYFGVSMAELLDPYNDPITTINGNMYSIDNLYWDSFYYWKVVPYTDKVRATDVDIWSFFVTEIIPSIDQITPANNSIVLPVKTMTITWDINYSKPSKVTCILFWGTNPDFDEDSGINLGNDRSYVLTDLSERSYYWKIVPYLDNLLGRESETWKFTIKQIEIPRTELIKPINTTIYTGVVELQWRVDYSDEEAKAKIKYEIRLDNSTDDPALMKIIKSDYKGTFHTAFLDYEQNLTYYWYVTPYLELGDGAVIAGACRSGVVHFTFGKPDTVYDIELKIEPTELKLEPGSNDAVKVIVKNKGNVRTTVDITITSTAGDVLKPSLEYRTKSLAKDETFEQSLNILALISSEMKNYTITLTATAMESTIETSEATLTVSVVQDASDGDGGKDDATNNIFSGLSSFIWLLIFVIILLIALFSYTKIKRHRILEHERREMIYNYIKAHPGEHFRGVQRALNLEVGVIGHHINKLERGELIKSRQDGQYRRFYPMDAKIDVKLILSQIQERILNWIKQNPGVSGSKIASGLGVDSKLINYHVNVLENAGFIYVEKQGREKLCFFTTGI